MKRPSAPKQAPPVDSLGFLQLLWSIHHGLQSASKRMERELGITGPQRLVIRLLSETPGMTAGELARALHLDPGTLSGIIARLVRDRLIRRAADPHDERRFLLALAPRGRQLVARREGTIEQEVGKVLASASADDLAGAARLLGQLAQSLRER